MAVVPYFGVHGDHSAVRKRRITVHHGGVPPLHLRMPSRLLRQLLHLRKLARDGPGHEQEDAGFPGEARPDLHDDAQHASRHGPADEGHEVPDDDAEYAGPSEGPGAVLFHAVAELGPPGDALYV